MSVQAVIEAKVRDAFRPLEIQVENESHKHSGPATESHFKLTVVAEAFDGQSLVQRHQQLYKLLADEMAAGVHALALHLYTPDEWRARQATAPDSPDCRGGSKAG